MSSVKLKVASASNMVSQASKKMWNIVSLICPTSFSPPSAQAGKRRQNPSCLLGLVEFVPSRTACLRPETRKAPPIQSFQEVWANPRSYACHMWITLVFSPTDADKRTGQERKCAIFFSESVTWKNSLNQASSAALSSLFFPTYRNRRINCFSTWQNKSIF